MMPTAVLRLCGQACGRAQRGGGPVIDGHERAHLAAADKHALRRRAVVIKRWLGQEHALADGLIAILCRNPAAASVEPALECASDACDMQPHRALGHRRHRVRG